MTEVDASFVLAQPRMVLSLWRGQIPDPRNSPTMAKIVRAISRRSGVSVDDIMGRRIRKPIYRVRQEAMWACWQVRRTDGRRRWSSLTIGQFFGRDHATVLHAVKQHEFFSSSTDAIKSVSDGKRRSPPAAPLSYDSSLTTGDAQ